MAIPPSSTHHRGQTAIPTDKSNRSDAKPAPDEQPVSTAQQQRKAQNVAILQANQQVSLKTNNSSLSLLYKTAIDSINAELKPVAGDNAAQKIYESDTDTSAEATAERIVSYATSYFSRYQKAADTPPEQTLGNYLALITKSIDKGFADASDILSKLKINDGDIKADVDKTYELVKQGLAHFRQTMLAGKESDTPASAVQPDS